MNNTEPKAPPSILIVEDESIVAMDLSFRLEEMGYTVVGVADTGEEAIALALSQKPDVVLMDLRLKTDMTGMEAARVIETQAGIPVVFVTAYTDAQTMAEIQRKPDFLLVMKPFVSSEIQTAIGKALTWRTDGHTLSNNGVGR